MSRQKVKEKEVLKGTVTNCLTVYLRKEPDPESNVLLILKALTDVVVDPLFENDKYYKVMIPSIVRNSVYDVEHNYHGYIDKRYVSLKG